MGEPPFCGTLLYDPEQLKTYFAKDRDRQVAHFVDSLARANEYMADNPPDTITPRVGKKTGLRSALQYYADEMFLTLYAFVSLDLVDRAAGGVRAQGPYSRLLDLPFGAARPKISGPKLLLEQPVPAPRLYVQSLLEQYRDHEETCHPVWYRRRLGKGNSALEGKTHTDALLACDGDWDRASGTFVMFEAKFLSDISASTTYATDRDQLTRNLDAGLEYVGYDLDRFWYVFVTPECFKDEPESRFYGYKLRDYMDPESGGQALSRALPHLADRELVDFAELSRHIGWVTWQDVCRLLATSPAFTTPAFPRAEFEQFFRDRCLWPEDETCRE